MCAAAATIESLPLELHHSILRHLTLKDWAQLLQVNLLLRASTASYLGSLREIHEVVSGLGPLFALAKLAPRLSRIDLGSGQLDPGAMAIAAAGIFPELQSIVIELDMEDTRLLSHPRVPGLIESAVLSAGLKGWTKSELLTRMTNLVDVKISGPLRASIPRLPRLEGLTLHSVEYDEDPPTATEVIIRAASDPSPPGFLFYGPNLPALREFEFQGGLLQGAWLSSLAQCPSLESLYFSDCTVTPGFFLEARLPALVRLTFQSSTCNRGHLAHFVRNHFHHLREVQIGCHPAMFPALSGVNTPVKKLQLILQEQPLSQGEMAALPEGIAAAPPGSILNFEEMVMVHPMDFLLSATCLEFLELGGNLAHGSRLQFPGEGQWLHSLTEVRIQCAVDLASLEALLPELVSLALLEVLSENELPDEEDHPTLAISSPSLATLLVRGPIRLSLVSLPRIGALHLSTSILSCTLPSPLPNLASLWCQPTRALEIHEWKAFLMELIVKAPACSSLHLDRFSDNLLEALKELRGGFLCGSITLSRQRDMARFLSESTAHFRELRRESSPRLLSLDAPIPETATASFCVPARRVHQMTNIPELAVSKFPGHAFTFWGNHPELRFFLLYTFSNRAPCPFAAESCLQSGGFFGI